MAVIDDGSGESLYFGTGGSPVTPVSEAPLYRWNGSGWDLVINVEPGVAYAGGIRALMQYNDGSGDSLFVGGSLDQRVTSMPPATKYAAKLSGGTLGSLADIEGRQLSNTVNALAVYDRGDKQVLIAAGAFVAAGDVTLQGVGMWDGARWSPLGEPGSEGVTGGTPSMLAVFDGGDGPYVYVAGTFTAAGGQAANRIARWSMEPRSPCPADLTGPSFDSIPDGILNHADLNFYIALWLAEDPAADISGPGGDGSPDGLVTIHDLVYYVDLWLVGCPSS